VKAEEGAPEDKAGSTAIRTGEWTDTAVQSAAPSSDIKAEGGDRPRTAALVKISLAEDSSTQLSSSSGSGKPPSIDGKSVASATTFALDEKESLRPDDSASLRAVEEEDVTSPPESVVADSRHGSDHGAARAFRDQLHEIAVMNPQPHRGVPPGRFPTLPSGPQTLYDPNQPPSGARMPQPVHGMPVIRGGGVPESIIPDEKVLEALQSPRDRLFIVKLEQDFIDFIKEPSESEYALPNCNAFYRMLAHRLADYYALGHVVDSDQTGVKITRTPFCRIPPPVSQMVDPAKGADTPPADLPARKIMRRDDGKSGTNTTSNSRNPSKTTSEAGGSDGSDDKDKTAMTREEREARYKEARQRIFGNAEAEEGEATEGAGSGEEKDKDPSRSSSRAGNKKKNTRKQRNYDDDDFQARSHYNVYYPQQYPTPDYSPDNAVYYSGYQGPTQNPQYPGVNPSASPRPAYSNAYQSMVPQGAQAQYGWSGQHYQPPNNTMYPNFPQMQNGYDVSNDFQRMSFQTSQVTPKMSNVPMAPYQDPYAQAQPGWYSGGPQGQFSSPGPGNRPMSAPQGHIPSPYAYGQFPGPHHAGRPNHPIPGSYNRPQFNPQSQAFIPTPRSMVPYPMQPQAPHGYRVPSSSSTPSFGSPQSMQGVAGSSIAKYGTPAHLPPRPPAPEHVPQKTPAMVVNGGNGRTV